MQNPSDAPVSPNPAPTPAPAAPPAPSPEPEPASPEPTPDAAPAPDTAPEAAPSPEELAKSFAAKRAENFDVPKPKEDSVTKKQSKKAMVLILVIFFLLLAGGAAFYLFYLKDPFHLLFAAPAAPVADVEDSPTSSEPEPVNPEPSEKFYSRLSGEEIANAELDSAPTFCVQIPNGVDGARDQVGLDAAKVVFEAIAEAGITRFAAVFQNPPAVIGPIRSLRIYYFNWDIPFGCTIVHAGGAQDALQALHASGARELDESTTYMWRSDAYYPSGQADYRRWNNLFTEGGLLAGYAANKGYLTSDIQGFPHLTPEAAALDRTQRQIVTQLKIDVPASGDTSELSPRVRHIVLSLGQIPNFNPVFDYNPETNSYNRSYQTGSAHNVFSCETKDSCTRVQLSPQVVIAMVVQEKRAAYDNYHEDISSLGAGDAYIFQNGDVYLGSWEKSSKDTQIVFRDKSGESISLVPGQTWITAVPNYGSVHYE